MKAIKMWNVQMWNKFVTETQEELEEFKLYFDRFQM